MNEILRLGSGFEVRKLGQNINVFSQNPNLDSPDSSPIAPTDAVCYARYLGCAPSDFSALDIGCVNGATLAVLGGGGYAEVGIGIGDFPDDITIPLDPTITPIAFTSVAAEVAAGIATQWVKRVTGGIKAGQGVWALFVVNAVTTDPIMRAILNANHFGKFASRAATRISTNLNSALVFNGAAATASTNNWVFHAHYVR